MVARIVCVAAACAGLGAGTAMAAPGELDKTFGARGAIDDGGCGTCAIAAGAGGDLVVARTFGGRPGLELLRYRRDGTRDPRFGDGDGLAADLAYQEGMTAMALQPDGKLVVAVAHTIASDGKLAEVRRYDQQGRRDPAFGSGGSVFLRGVDEFVDVDELAVRPDGGIVVAGETVLQAPFSGEEEPPEYTRLTVWALRPDGSPDPGFAGGRADLPGLGGVGHSLAVQRDGGVVVSVGREHRELLVRLRRDGTPDESFGPGGQSGRATADRLGGADLSHVALQPDGKLLALRRYEMARYLPDGRLDPGFGERGVASLIAPRKRKRKSESATARLLDGADLAVAPDGRIVVAGIGSVRRPDTGYDTSYGAARLLPSGCRDASFGTRGIVVGRPSRKTQRVPFGAEDVALQPGGRLVLAGAGFITRQRAPMLIRLKGGGRGRCSR